VRTHAEAALGLAVPRLLAGPLAFVEPLWLGVPAWAGPDDGSADEECAGVCIAADRGLVVLEPGGWLIDDLSTEEVLRLLATVAEALEKESCNPVNGAAQ
jgi:hypothetical protein